MKNKVVVKAGGSAITHKDKEGFPLELTDIINNSEEFIRKDNMQTIANTIQHAQKELGFQLFLINGAGPYGHDLVSAYKSGKKMTAQTIHDSVAYLNSYLCSYFGDKTESIPSINTCSCIEKSKFNISELFDGAKNILNKKRIPTAYGDLVPIEEKCIGQLESNRVIEGKYTIISGDDLITHFAESWPADVIISVSNVKGVYTDNPRINLNAKLINEITADGTPFIKKMEELGVNFAMIKNDETGGFFKKIEKIYSFVYKTSIPAIITDPAGLNKALYGEAIGTLISKS